MDSGSLILVCSMHNLSFTRFRGNLMRLPGIGRLRWEVQQARAWVTIKQVLRAQWSGCLAARSLERTWEVQETAL